MALPAPAATRELFSMSDELCRLAEAVFARSRSQIRHEHDRLSPPPSRTELDADVEWAIGPVGIGAERALALFTDVVADRSNWQGHPRSLAFVPHAPAPAAAMLDMLLSSATFMGTSWLEAAGATAAENAALRWLAEQAGLPPSAGGVFLPGGTMANLNALAVAAHQRRLSWRDGSVRPLGVATTAEAHSSVRLAAQILDQAVIPVGTDARGKMTAGSLTEALDHASVEVCAVVATAGQTNSGVIDDLSGVADVCAERGVWLHVDGSYGGAALLSARTRELLSGIERADSLAIDPHKWLFSPLDCSALLYRDPSLARLTFTQRAEYIEALRESEGWNPSDYGSHFTRRCRGLPFWFMLAVHGSEAVAAEIDYCLDLAQTTARLIDTCPSLELVMEPELSIVLFRRLGWTMADYQAWCDDLLARNVAFIVPTHVERGPALRFCFVNPLTTVEDVQHILAALA